MQTSATNGFADADSVNAVFRAMALDRIEDLAKSLLGELDPVKRRAGIEAIISVATAGQREPDAATRERLSEKIRETRATSAGSGSPKPRESRNPDFTPLPPSPAAAPSTSAPRTVRRSAPRYF